MLQMLFGYRHYAHRKCPTSFVWSNMTRSGSFDLDPGLMGKPMNPQSPPKESIHLRQSQVLKTEWDYRKSRACDTPTIDLLNGWFGAPPSFHLAPLNFKYSAWQNCMLSFGGDCMVHIFEAECRYPTQTRQLIKWRAIFRENKVNLWLPLQSEQSCYKAIIAGPLGPWGNWRSSSVILCCSLIKGTPLDLQWQILMGWLLDKLKKTITEALFVRGRKMECSNLMSDGI